MGAWTLDLHPNSTEFPEVDQIILSKANAFRITDVREVDSRSWSNRWRIQKERISTRSEWEANHKIVGLKVDCENLWIADDGSEVRYAGSYRKGETPQEYFGCTKHGDPL